MIVPNHWAEARVQQRIGKRQITVRRWGWSDSSHADAQTMADRRAAQAMADIVAGQRLVRRERKLAYNGAQGLPIREEVLSRHGDTVISRNAYGAHCLNTPHVVFADVDYADDAPHRLTWLFFAVLAISVLAIAKSYVGAWAALLAVVLGGLVCGPVAKALHQGWVAMQGGKETLVRKRLESFVSAHPDWNVRMYRTPAGVRLLATHALAEPANAQVQAFMSAVRADPLYVRMCLNQQCFRARLTGKPWRMGINTPMRPRPGVWPVRPEALPVRNAWTLAYDQQAQSYAACQWLGDVGSGKVHIDVQPVMELHDALSRAHAQNLPLA